MPNPFRIARAVAKPAAPPKGALSVLPAAERDANLQRMLSESKVQQRLYHGTTATEGGKGQEAIRRFKPSKSGSLGSGTYLTPNSAQASGYSGIPNDDAIQAMLMSDSRPTRLLGLESYKQRGSGDVLPSQEGGNMLPVYAQVKNPLIIDGAHPDPMVEALIKLGMDEDKAGRMVERAYENKGYIGKEVQQRAQAQGYDGLMQYRNGDLSEVVTYNPNAVKSAIGNRGTYDTTKPDLNEAGGGLIKGALQAAKGASKAPAVNRLDMNFKDVTKRVPELTEAANKVAAGEMTAKQYDKLVNKHKPVTPYDFVPQPATADDAMRALTENKRPMFGKASEMAPGEQADLRLDIPAYKDHGVWVNSIHRKDQPTVYGSTSSVKNATMIGSPDKALKVAQGGPKAPFAVMRGEWNPMSEADAVANAQKYLNHPDWRQVGYDPERHGYFYDRATMNPITNAEEVIQIGPLVLAKKPVYGKKADEKYAEGGAVNHEGNTMKLPHDVIPRKHIDAHGHALKHFMKGGAVKMEKGGAAFGQYTTGKKYQGAKKRAETADVNSLADPRTYAFVSGLLGEAPDQLGFSVMHPDYEGIQDVGEKGFMGGTILGVAPAVGPITKGLPVGASIKPIGGNAAKGAPAAKMTDRQRAFVEKFGQKQEQEAARQKKVEKLAQESAGKSPEASVKPAKSKGRREAVPPDIYRQMAKEFGDEAVIKAATAGEHLKPTGSGYIGAPRTVTSPQGLGAMRRAIDKDFTDSVEALELSDPTRLGTWYDRAKQGLAESSEPYQLPRVKEEHSVYSAGVSPESETGFALKHRNSRVAGEPTMAYRGSGMRTLDTAVAQDRPAKLAFKVGEYGEKNDPRLPNTGLFGVNDFRRAQGMGYTDPQGNPWKAGVSATMHPFMDAETALQVNRANTAGLGGRTDWQGPHIQELPWVYGKAQDFYGRGKNARYKGDEFEGMSQAMRDANNTARDYFYKHAASATHEQIPGVGVGHVRQALKMTPDEKLAYGREGRFDMPAPEMALNEFPEVGAGNRDAIYGALGYRQLPSRDASGLYINSLGEVEKNPMTIARPLMDFPTGGGGGRMSESSSKVMDTGEQFRALIDAQEAGAYNLPNTMSSVKGKNAMVLDTRGQVADPLADPSAGVLPSADQLGQITNALNAASGKAEKAAKKVRDKMPYGPPTKSVHNKLVNLDDAAGGYGVTATNRGALIFPYNSQAGGGGLNEIMKISGKEIEGALPGARREKAIASTGYVPGVGKRTSEGPQLTAPYSGEATSDMLQAFSELPQSVSLNLSESEAVRSAIRAKALRDSKMGGTRGDIQETRRFFSEADWPKAVDMIRRGMTPAAALAALGYSASSMAGER